MNTMSTIYFDMDGTLADLYGVTNWLNMLEAYDTTPFEIAKPLINLTLLARLLHRVQRRGHRICILSATSKTGTPEYNARIQEAKTRWLAQHLPSIAWDEVIYVPYGATKNEYAIPSQDKILFDDEERHRSAWNGTALSPDKIIKTLHEISHL